MSSERNVFFFSWNRVIWINTPPNEPIWVNITTNLIVAIILISKSNILTPEKNAKKYWSCLTLLHSRNSSHVLIVVPATASNPWQWHCFIWIKRWPTFILVLKLRVQYNMGNWIQYRQLEVKRWFRLLLSAYAYSRALKNAPLKRRRLYKPWIPTLENKKFKQNK